MGQNGNGLIDRANQIMLEEVKEEISKEAKKHQIKLDDKNIIPSEEYSHTRKILIPKEMNKLQAAHNLAKQFQEEEILRNFNRVYENVFINDFLIAIEKLVIKYFGMLHVSRYNTAGNPVGENYIQFQVGFDSKGEVKTEKGYIGSVKCPVWEDAIMDIKLPSTLIVRAKAKFEKSVNEFLAEVEHTMREASVVRGTSVSIQETNGGLMTTPQLVIENNKIVLSDKVERIINNLIIPGLRNKGKVSLLFTGDFGTGKTETALRVGDTGRRRYGRTFFYLKNASMFGQLIPYIKNYQPAIVFCEDVDQISAGDRDSAMNDLLNQLDGNELKNINCTFIFTTNSQDKIHPAMRRPGRIDQIVHFDYCTEEAVAKIFKLWAEGKRGSDDVDYEAAAKDCPPKLQGAVVAEIAKRAIQYADNMYDGEISTERFKDAIASMTHHIEFMKEDQQKDHTMENLMGHVFYKAMKQAFPAIGTGVIAGGAPLPDFADQPYKGLDS